MRRVLSESDISKKQLRNNIAKRSISLSNYKYFPKAKSILMFSGVVTSTLHMDIESHVLITSACVMAYILSIGTENTNILDKWRLQEAEYEDKYDPPSPKLVFKSSDHNAHILWLIGAILLDCSSDPNIIIYSRVIKTFAALLHFLHKRSIPNGIILSSMLVFIFDDNSIILKFADLSVWIACILHFVEK
tara:strand:+ start:4881 stop:5450 length:570 start_codon:yes stop_codon:yes gene_type:complete